MAQVPELQRFRAKYPEYGDMDDAALADRLAAKYPEAYSDLPGKVRSETPEPPRQDHNFGGVAISAPPAEGSRQEVMGIASPADRRAARTAINIAKPIPAMGYAQVKQGLGGLARIVGAEEWGKAQTDEAEAVIRQIETEHPLERDSWAEAARSAGASIVAQAPSLALGAVGAPMAGLALLGAQAGGAEIDLQLDKGAGKPQAALAGGTVGLAEALTEKIPFDNLFARGIPVGKRLLKQYVSELLGENIATSVESAVHKITVEPDMTWDDYVRALKNTTKQTIVQTSVMGGAASAIHGLAGGETADSSPQAPRRPVGPDTDLLSQLPDDPEYTARQERVQSRLATAIQPAQQAQASDNVGSFLDPMMRRAMENRRGASFAPDPLVTNTVNAVPVGAPYERVEAEVLPPAQAIAQQADTSLLPWLSRDVEAQEVPAGYASDSVGGFLNRDARSLRREQDVRFALDESDRLLASQMAAGRETRSLPIPVSGPQLARQRNNEEGVITPYGEEAAARPAGMGRAETAPVTDTSAKAVPPVRGVDGQSGDGMPVVQSGDVAVEQAIPGADSGNTAAGVVEGGDTGGQEEGRRQEVLNNEGATPLPETVSAPRPPASFDEMVQEAARWKGAATKVSASLGDDKKAQVRHNKLTTKGDLDAYLMRKFGVDEVTARDVSNALTAQNIPADKTADIQDFASEPWAVPAQETSGPSTRPADVNKENAGDGAILSQEAQNGQRAENPAMAGAVQGSQGISGVADGAADTQAEGRATDARDGALRDDDLLRSALQTLRDVESDNIIIDGNRARASWSTRDSLVPWLDIPGWTPRQAALALEKYLANPNDRTIGKTQRLVVEKALAYERELADRYAAEIETYTDELASADVSFDFGFNATEETDNSVQTDPAPRFERTAAGDQGKLFATPPSFGTKKQGGVAGLEDMALFTEPKERAAEQAQTTLQSILSSERGSIELPNREEAAAMVKGMTDSLNRLFGSATGVYGATKLMAADAAETLFGKPIFTAERRPTLKPVVENAINRQQDFHETLANFYEWNEDEGTVTTLIDLRKEHKKLPRADKKAVAKLVFEGDILKGEFETVESARAALGGDVAVSRTAFDFYRRFRAYINTLYRKVRQEQVANALVPYESSPELHDTLRAMLEYDGELNADMVEPAVWDAFMDVKGMQLIAPEYQNKPWFDDLVNLLGYKFRERSQKHAWNKQAPWKEVKGTPEKWADKISTDTLESPARMKELVAALKHIQENKLIEKRVRRAKEQVMEARKGLKAMRDDFGALPGWFPRLRNDGRFYVAVTMPAAEAGAKPVLVYYELVGSPEAAKLLEKKIAADPSRYVPKEYQGEGAEFTTSTGESSKLDESIYAAAAGDLAIQAVIDRGLSRMKDKEGLNDSEYDELQSSLYRSTLDVILARGAGRHQIKRADHLIGGYRTDDPFQILDDYIRGTVGSITKARYSMRQAIALRELSGSDQAWAFGYVRDTLMNTSQAQRVAATMAGIATFNYLGFRFTSALLNATQNWTYGYPELSIHSRRAASVMAKAQKDILTGRKLGAEEQAALEQGIRKGMSMETITSEMAGHGEGMQNRFGQGVTALNNVSMWLFQMVERYVNREAGFLAAYRVFRTPDFAPTRQDPYDSVAVEKALDFVAKVHGVPGKANMPAWARTNPVGRGVFTLSSFTMDRFNWLFNRLTSGEKQQVMAAARAVGVMVLLGGVGSLPFLDEINRLLRKLFGVDFKLEARKWVEEKARDYGAPEDAIADYIFHGAPAGAGINVSNAMRVQVPIASALLQGEGALEAVSGPLGGVVLKIAKAGEMAAKGEGDKALESLAPEAVATALRAKRLSEEGMTTSGGKLILDRDPKTGEIGPVKLDPSERAVKSLGFNPLEASKRMEKADTRIALKQFWTERKDRALARVNALLLTGKQEDRQTANNLVLKFNARLAESQARGLVPPITRVKPYKLDKRAIQWDSAQEEE